MSKTNPEQGTREKLYAMLRGAHDGTESLTWFHNLVIRAGYTKVQIGVDALLVTVNQLVKIWGLSMRTVRCMIAEGLPCARQGVGAEPSLFDLAICEAWRRKRDESDPDHFLGGPGQSKELEKYRKEKARQAKRENDLAEGRIFEADSVFAVAEEVGDALRVEFEALERVHGPAVGQALREAVERMAKGWSARMTALAGTGPVAAAKGEVK